ncbi:hypothetical protein HPB52_006191 [Rhipicephalus sanguineus]|uniref:Peptidase M13 N-terminal domain-containing protein n=1 Tax=Rhipicephalus sanguineus TaxID=34632 RepID=A0A9D4QD93_RHISA|nr:hypothetical protein HPB52_006191 [Rhipicephalus sanguineus]
MRADRIPPGRRNASGSPTKLPMTPACTLVSPADTSRPGSWGRYSCFVLLTAFVTSATLMGMPTYHLWRRRHWSRVSLERDLQRSRDHGVHPCDDFYQHVCSGWDGNHNRRYRTPLAKYSSAFDQRVVDRVLLRPFHTGSARAEDKASSLLLMCLSRTGRRNKWSLSKVLVELGLPWPMKSEITRYDLLNTLVKASLHFGTPLFWAFYVGRHPSRSHENTIYMTLEPRCAEWIADFERLMARGRHDDYLRRCAEIVGGIGQSYSTMIHAVTTTHLDIAEKVRTFWDQMTLPRLQRMNDFELRRAVNGHLPDDSQLWLDDEIVNLQPLLYRALNETHFSGNAESFMLYLGAYAVWWLSPYASRYLTAAMLADMGWAGTWNSHRRAKCLEALGSVMPLARSNFYQDAQGDKSLTWTMQRLTVQSVSRLGKVIGEAFGRTFNILASRVYSNAYNMTLTWGLLDQVYAQVHLDGGNGFFDLYLRACRLSVAVFKQSMRRPRNILSHAPGIADVRFYRNLVMREVVVQNNFVSEIQTDSRHMLSMLSALVGTEICEQLLAIVYFLVQYDDSFTPIEGLNESTNGDDSLKRYGQVIRTPSFTQKFTLRELRRLVFHSVIAYFASYIPSLPEAVAITAVWTEAHASDEQNSFVGVPVDQLFFLVSCFNRCGEAGTVYELQASFANPQHRKQVELCQ